MAALLHPRPTPPAHGALPGDALAAHSGTAAVPARQLWGLSPPQADVCHAACRKPQREMTTADPNLTRPKRSQGVGARADFSAPHGARIGVYRISPDLGRAWLHRISPDLRRALGRARLGTGGGGGEQGRREGPPPGLRACGPAALTWGRTVAAPCAHLVGVHVYGVLAACSSSAAVRPCSLLRHASAPRSSLAEVLVLGAQLVGVVGGNLLLGTAWGPPLSIRVGTQKAAPGSDLDGAWLCSCTAPSCSGNTWALHCKRTDTRPVLH